MADDAPPADAAPPDQAEAVAEDAGKVAFPVVCLGASAGGLEALTEFLDTLPSPTGAAFVVVVHLSPDFKSLMPELLGRHTLMRVLTAEDATPVEPEHVYVIPANKTMRMRGSQLTLTTRNRSANVPNLPIDVFMQSMAEAVGPQGTAIILSGTGSDGSRGAQAVKEAGGAVMIQDPRHAKFDGMPLATRLNVVVDAEGTPSQLAEHVFALLTEAPPDVPAEELAQQNALRRLFNILAADGTDLSFLRPPMVLRRLQRRMQLGKHEALEAYLGVLEQDAHERRQLRGDLLINVTHFFREPKSLNTLREEVLPSLLSDATEQGLRVWVAGCATGQEAYTLAILIEECMHTLGIHRDYKVFATDIDKEALEKAARASYSLNEANDLPREYLDRYFTIRDGRVAVRESLRQRVIFAAHNLVTDPPFVRMDIVSCRNLLIYLDPQAQQDALASLHQALQPSHGVLLLGAAESTAPLREAFIGMSGRGNLYRRGESPEPRSRGLRTSHDPMRAAFAAPIPRGRDKDTDLNRLALETVFEAEGMSAALINRRGELQDVLCDPGRNFAMPKGPPTSDLTRILDSTLSSGLLRGLAEIGTTPGPAETIVPTAEGSMHLLLRPIANTEQLLLVMRPLRTEGQVHEPVPTDSQSYIDSLNMELQRTKQTLQSTIEELQSANEEQQATNEELVASNEELQSTNEELHSVNEELYTVNAEFQNRNRDLMVATADLDNLLSHTAVATIYLDELLNVRRLNGAVNRLLPVRKSDMGRPLADFVHRLEVDLVGLARTVLETGENRELEVRDSSGAWQLLRATPHESGDAPRGVLMTLIDVTRLKNAEASARTAHEQLTLANANLREQADQLEDMFSVISHDLRRPLLIIDGMLELGLETVSSEDAKGFLGKAKDATNQLRATLDELTDLTRNTRAPLKLEEIRLSSWVAEVLEPLERRAKEQGVALVSIVEGRRAEIPLAAVRGILVNLVENALVHGSTADEPRVNVLVQSDASRLRISVADNGKGIPSNKHSAVFELFQRLDPDAPGSGVGLVAVRRFASRAGGWVRVESESGEGARFIAELPIAKVRETGNRVLLLEDDEVDAKRVRIVLGDQDITWTKRLADARARLAEEHFALLILDLSLPDGHGLDLLPDLSTGPNKEIPVIVLSGHDDGLTSSILPRQVVATHNKDCLDDAAIRTSVEQQLGLS
ncbi:MAG: CheR family methyltransferase [Nannocystaceae bacterium]|nr:ATP-binding protein [bacterium]